MKKSKVIAGVGSVVVLIGLVIIGGIRQENQGCGQNIPIIKNVVSDVVEKEIAVVENQDELEVQKAPITVDTKEISEKNVKKDKEEAKIKETVEEMPPKESEDIELPEIVVE